MVNTPPPDPSRLLELPLYVGLALLIITFFIIAAIIYSSGGANRLSLREVITMNADDFKNRKTNGVVFGGELGLIRYLLIIAICCIGIGLVLIASRWLMRLF